MRSRSARAVIAASAKSKFASEYSSNISDIRERNIIFLDAL